MHHFFVGPRQIEGDRVRLTPEQAHQVARVLRLREGECVLVLDGAGCETEAVLAEVTASGVVARVGEWRPCAREPRVHLALGLGILKGEKMEWAIQKATEVGISQFVPLACARSVVRVEDGRSAGKVARWQRIAQEAAEQCRRGRVPAVEGPTPFAAVLHRAPAFDLVLLADEGECAPLAAILPARAPGSEPLRVLLLIGPEGGFSPEEAAAARASGASAVSLGPRILRAETAAVVGAALVLHELER